MNIFGTLKSFASTVWIDYVTGPVLTYTRRKASSDDRHVYVLYVDPNEIVYTKLFAPDRLPVTGENAVCGAAGGPWDRFKYRFDRHYVYRTLKARIVDGTEWSETPIATRYRDRPEKFERRCEEIDRLIESIRRNGYRLQSEIDNRDGEPRKKRRIGSVEFPDEITVGMDRRGRLIHLRGGRHRLAAAQLLEVDEIPVLLSLYHPKSSDDIPSDARRVAIE
jgi:hypothetical protein